jgi:hypothetical protein
VNRRPRTLRALPFTLGLLAVGLTFVAPVAGCSSANDTAQTTITLPDQSTYAPVAGALIYRCGSLDCHGTVWRNFRLYGYDGQRLDADAGVDGVPTTDAEVAADFAAFVGLEPEILSAVVLDHGADPDRLTLIRKARGLEDHKGGQRMTVGDDADLCVTGWLAGTPNNAACLRVPTEP